MDSQGDNNKMSSDSDIRSKLTACEERIAQLEQQLAIQHELRDSLLKQLHQETSPPTGRISLPNEILLQIFEGIVAIDSPTMWHILLVSRKWNQLAMSQQSLWARLSFQVPATNAIKYLVRSTHYAKQALLRSGELLIDVLVDFRGAPDLDTITFSEATSGFLPKGMIKDKDFWWNSWHYHSSPSRRDSCTFADLGRDVFFEFMRSLKHQASHRWRMFTFKTASHLSRRSSDNRGDFTAITFQTGDTPALERVDLLDYNANWISTVPDVKHLLIHSKHLQSRNTYRGHRNAALRVLHIHVNSTLPDLRDAGMLRVLSVDIKEDLDPEKMTSFRLPSLKTLSLRGPSAHAVLRHLDAPGLHALKLIGKQTIESASQLVGDLRLPHLHLLAADSGASSVRAFLGAIISECIPVGSIFVMPWHLVIAKETQLLESGTTAGPTVHTLEWNVNDANSEGLEELLWRSDEEKFHYRAHHIS